MVLHLPPGCVELNQECVVFGKLFIEVLVGEDEDALLHLGGRSESGEASSNSQQNLSHLIYLTLD